jgi:hypothetical protein
LASGDHPGIGDHGHIGEVVGGLEGVDHRQHGGSLGLVALEGFHGQREPRSVGEQPDGDLRISSYSDQYCAKQCAELLSSPARSCSSSGHALYKRGGSTMAITEQDVIEKLRENGITTIEELAQKIAEQSAAVAEFAKVMDRPDDQVEYVWSGKNYSLHHPE